MQAPHDRQGDPVAGQVAIYAAVIRYLFAPSVPGGTLPLYIVRATNDAAGDPSIEAPESVVLPKAVQAGITAALGDFPTHVVWVDRFTDVHLAEEGGAVVGGGVIVQVGNIRREAAGHALVPASIYARERTTGGALYRVEKRTGAWMVAGTQGGSWSTQ
ncbi:MAG: hypothetical protein U0587_02755 [Candidatus Binatia bacterium]